MVYTIRNVQKILQYETDSARLLDVNDIGSLWDNADKNLENNIFFLCRLVIRLLLRLVSTLKKR